MLLSSPGKVYTLNDVSKHDRPDDLWMVIYNKVYSVGDFVAEHPGGAEVMFECGGVDATKAFEDVGHSDDALYMLEPYYIGELAEADCLQYKHIHNPSSNLKVSRLSHLEPPKTRRKKRKRAGLNRGVFARNLYLIFLAVLALVGLASYFFLQRMKWHRKH